MSPLLPPQVPGNLSHFILWTGDSGLTTLVAVALGLALAVPRATRRLAPAWFGAFALATSLVFATKLGLFGWGTGIAALDFRGPSGHATLSALVWPMAASVLTVRARPKVRLAAFALSAALALAVAGVLIAYGFHSAPETIAGSLLGGSVALACIHATRSAIPPPPHVTVAVALALVALFWVQHGQRLRPLEQFKHTAHRMVLQQKPAEPLRHSP